MNVFDAEGNTLGVGYFKSKLAQGESEIVLGFELPDDLKSGVAEVYTNVFTDWPDRGGVPITNELSANVQIVGLDKTPPELSVPGNDIIYTNNDLGGSAGFEISATDNVGVSLLECTSDLSSVNDAFTLDPSQVVAPLFATGKIDGVLFPEGTTQIDCKAEDAEGNVAEKSFTFEVIRAQVDEEQPPVVEETPEQVVEAPEQVVEESRIFTHVIYGDELKIIGDLDRNAVIQFTGNPNGLKGFELYDKSLAPNTSNCQSGWNADEYSVCVFETKNMALGYHEWFDRTTDTSVSYTHLTLPTTPYV